MRKLILALVGLVIVGGGAAFWYYKQPRAPAETEEAYETIVAQDADLVKDVFIPPTDTTPEATYKVYWPQLEETNPDIFGWLYIPDTPINFPLLQEQTLLEYFYLDHNYKRESQFSGSIFTPAEPLGVEDAHLLLFGHHTKNKAVAFSSLFDLYGSEESGKLYEDAYICYPTETVHLKLWCATSTTVEDSIYEIPYILGSMSYDKLLRQMEVNCTYSVCETPSSKEPIVVLSTCNGEVGGAERFYVAFVQAD